MTRAVQLLALATLLGLSACKDRADRTSQAEAANPPKTVEMVTAQTATLNYAPWYVDEWGIEGPATIVEPKDGTRIEGAGPNAHRAASPDRPTHDGGKYCCMKIPAVWQPDLRLTVHWLVDKKNGGLRADSWYKAENVRIPEYDKPTGDVWVVFLPDDRIRIMVPDEVHGDNNPDTRPRDDDPYIAHGVPDQEWNRLYVERTNLSPVDQANLPKSIDMAGASTSTLNYTPWYIHTWGFEGPANIVGREGRQSIGGGGPNVMPADSPDKPGGGGKESCCSNIPEVWDPDLRLTVRWLVDKKQDGKTPGYWRKAENVRIPNYDGKKIGKVWAVFLPDDRIRIMVSDGQEGENDPDKRPADDDPYIAQGVVDEEWNRLYRDGGNTQ